MQHARTDGERRQLLDQLKATFFVPPLVEHKYRLEEVIGEGSYGVVCSAVNTETGERVAVKRIMSVFDEIPEATRTLRELKFLRLLKDHENIISIKDVLLPSDREKFDDVFMVIELMPTDLTRVLRSNIELSPEHIRWLIFQLTRGIFYLHTCNVFHRDLKPSNILINASCDLRITDFGLSRAAVFNDNDPDVVFWTDYVATRWYRAPELIMSSTARYTTAIDMWSIGCIFAEMLNNGRPMFPGRNPDEQLRLIVEFCGTPPPEIINTVRESRARAMLSRMTPCQKKPLSSHFPNAEPLALDLLEKMLEFDPNNRISAERALKHPYLQYDTVVRGTPIDMEEFAFERQNLSVSDLRQCFLEEMIKYHPGRRHQYLDPADQPVLQYAVPDQATRFRDSMRAVQNGTVPPRAFESMPNQRLTRYYDHGNHSEAGSVVQQNSGEDVNMTASTVPPGGGDVTDNTERRCDGTSGPISGVTVRTSGIEQEGIGAEEAMQEEADNAQDASAYIRYAGLASVESAMSRASFGAETGNVPVGRQVSETVDSRTDAAPMMVADTDAATIRNIST